MKKRTIAAGLAVAATTAALLGGCSATASDDGLTKVVFALAGSSGGLNDVGVYIAKADGFFAEHGLDVEIKGLPDSLGKEAIVTQGQAQFGVSWQEDVSQAREQGIPIVSIAATIAHNTSAFVSLASEGITSPKDYAGKVYGGWGSPIEDAILRSLVEQSGGDPAAVDNINIGTTTVLNALRQQQTDLGWIFYASDGIAAEQQGVDLNYQYLSDVDPVLDWYTPVITTSEDLIASDPELVQAFVDAVSQGYASAIADPDHAADVLLAAVPDRDEATTRAGLTWLAGEFQSDAPRWGWQEASVWTNFSDWLEKAGILEPGFDSSRAFTNDFIANAG